MSSENITASLYPTLQRHHSTWIYHLLEDQHIILRCWENGTWISTTKQLKGNGMIHGSSNYPLTADKFQALPRISGIFQAAIDAAQLYVPDQLAVITSQELQTLEDSVPSEVALSNYIKSQIATPHRTMDMDSFVHANQATRRHYQHTSQCLTTFIILSSIVILVFTSYLLKTYWHKIILCCFIQKRTQDPTTPKLNPVNEVPRTSYETNASNKDGSDRTVTLSVYGLQ